VLGAWLCVFRKISRGRPISPGSIGTDGWRLSHAEIALFHDYVGYLTETRAHRRPPTTTGSPVRETETNVLTGLCSGVCRFFVFRDAEMLPEMPGPIGSRRLRSSAIETYKEIDHDSIRSRGPAERS